MYGEQTKGKKYDVLTLKPLVMDIVNPRLPPKARKRLFMGFLYIAL